MKQTITCIGTQAREMLARPDFSGEVLAVVSNAVYVERDEEIIWLAQNEVKHQRAMLASFDLSTWRVGMRFDGGMLDWTTALVWQPPIISSDQVAPREIVAARVEQLIDAIESLGEPRGFAQFIPLFRSIDATAAPTFDPITNAAMKPIVEMARAKNFMRALEIGRALIGLGQGLSPSGDDFIGGMIFAARCFQTTYPGTIDWNQESIDDLLAWARDKTNRISYTILCDHAAGQSVDVLHELMASILTGKKLDETMTHAQRLVRIGSTSGWEMLAGAMLATLELR